MMDMRLVKENILLEQPTAMYCSQALVEGDLTLPGGLREEARVLHAGAMVAVEKVEAMQDRATVMGRVTFHTLFTQGDHSRVHAMEATADFTHLMDLPGAQPRSRAHADGAVEHVEAAVSGGRLILRAAVKLCCRAVNIQPVEAVTGISGVAGVECRAEEISLRRTVALGESETLLREEFALPAELCIRETLYATAWSQVTGVTGGYTRAGVNGEITLEAVHASDLPGRPVVMTRHTMAFGYPVELTGEEGDQLQGRAWVKDVAVASQETAENERTLRAEVLLGLTGWADRQEKITLLSDAYTTSGDTLSLTAHRVRLRNGDDSASSAESGKAMLMLPEGSPAVKEVLCAFASPVMTGHEQLGGRLAVEGMLEVTLLYMSDASDVPVSVSVEEPFRLTFTAQPDDGDYLSLTVQHVDASAVTSDRVEMKYIMRLTAAGTRTAQAQLVTDVQPAQAVPPDSSIVLYFVQPGESLWDIAKRYRVAVGEIRELNPELKGEPLPGQGIVVWRRGK